MVFGSVRLAVPFGMTYVAICSSLSFLSGVQDFSLSNRGQFAYAHVA